MLGTYLNANLGELVSMRRRLYMIISLVANYWILTFFSFG